MNKGKFFLLWKLFTFRLTALRNNRDALERELREVKQKLKEVQQTEKELRFQISSSSKRNPLSLLN